MNDQHNLARSLSVDRETAEDPLEELARIVSGGLDAIYPRGVESSRSTRQEQGAGGSASDDHGDHPGNGSQGAEEDAQTHSHHSAVTQTESHTLEDQLLAELEAIEQLRLSTQANAGQAPEQKRPQSSFDLTDPIFDEFRHRNQPAPAAPAARSAGSPASAAPPGAAAHPAHQPPSRQQTGASRPLATGANIVTPTNGPGVSTPSAGGIPTPASATVAASSVNPLPYRTLATPVAPKPASLPPPEEVHDAFDSGEDETLSAPDLPIEEIDRAPHSVPALPEQPKLPEPLDLSAQFQAELEMIEAQRLRQIAEKRRSLQTALQTPPERFEPKPAAPVNAEPAEDLESEFAQAFARELHSEHKSPPTEAAGEESRHGFPVQQHFHAEDEEESEWDRQPLPAWRLPRHFDSADGDDFAPATDPAAEFADPHPLDPAYDPQYVEYEAEPRSGLRIWRVAALACIGALLLTGVGFGYLYFTNSEVDSTPTLVKAEPGPVRVKPEEPGGVSVANQDRAAYEKLSGKPAETKGAQEELVKTAEAPIEIPSSRPARPATQPEPMIADLPKTEERLAPPPAGSEAPQAQDVLAPRVVRSLAVLPDGTVINPPPAQAAPASTGASIDGALSDGRIGIPTPRPRDLVPGQPARTAAAGNNSAAQPAAEVRRIESPIPAGVTRDPVRVASVRGEALPGVSATDASTETISRSGDEWAVQIASQRSAQEAEAAFRELRAKYPDILNGQRMSMQQANIEGRGVFYRVRVMAQSREAANELCARLKESGGSCFVTR